MNKVNEFINGWIKGQHNTETLENSSIKKIQGKMRSIFKYFT